MAKEYKVYNAGVLVSEHDTREEAHAVLMGLKEQGASPWDLVMNIPMPEGYSPPPQVPLT